MDQEGRERAGAAVRDRITARGTTINRVARAAGIDPKTLRAVMDGKSWPRETTRHRLEAALDWPDGELMNRARGLRPSLAAYTTRELLTELERRTAAGETLDP